MSSIISKILSGSKSNLPIVLIISFFKLEWFNISNTDKRHAKPCEFSKIKLNFYYS